MRKYNKNEKHFIPFLELGVFEIGDDWRLWRKKVRHNGGFRDIKKRRADRITGVGYYYCSVWIQEARKSMGALAHRIIWTHLNGEIEDGLTINHKNGIKSDNNIDNLEVLTLSDNIKHAYRTGLASNKGKNAKLNVSDVLEIRNLLRTTELTQVKIGEMFNVSSQTINQINTGRKWNAEGSL